ncbi:MobA/MobL family protein, partial [Aerococcus urinaeequi]
MAIYHLSLNNISRGKGQSAIASASYRSGEKLYSERYGKTSYYVREVKPETFILAPKHAPKWANNREKLWNEVEKIEKSSRARLAKEINIALPIELDKDEQKSLVKQYVQE